VTIRTYAWLAAEIRSRPPRLGPVRLVAIDGPAGAGKTTFAERLAGELHAPVVHVDDLLNGWEGLPSVWPRLEEWVLGPLRWGRDAAYRTYDWRARRFRDGWVALPVPEALILEGVGSARAEAAGDLTLAVYLTADRDLRLARGLERDGEALRGEWLRWRDGAVAHFAADRTIDRADLVVDGVDGVDGSQESPGEFVILRGKTRAPSLRDDPGGSRDTGYGEATA
jgi:adenylate kinase family enzyme